MGWDHIKVRLRVGTEVELDAAGADLASLSAWVKHLVDDDAFV